MSKTATKSKIVTKRQANKLTDFILAKAGGRSPDESLAEWIDRKQVWLKELDSLYAKVREWLAPLEAEGVVKFHTTPITLEEEEIGRYDVEALHIMIGKQKVSFYPRGILFLDEGVCGQVNIRGPEGLCSLILNQGRWAIVRSSPDLRFKRIDRASFQEILSEVMA